MSSTSFSTPGLSVRGKVSGVKCRGGGGGKISEGKMSGGGGGGVKCRTSVKYNHVTYSGLILL